MIAAFTLGCNEPDREAVNSNQLKEKRMQNGIPVADYATDASIEVQTKEFLKVLNTSGGRPMETLTPVEARKVLEGAQSSVEVDLSGVKIKKKTNSCPCCQLTTAEKEQKK